MICKDQWETGKRGAVMKPAVPAHSHSQTSLTLDKGVMAWVGSRAVSAEAPQSACGGAVSAEAHDRHVGSRVTGQAGTFSATANYLGFTLRLKPDAHLNVSDFQHSSERPWEEPPSVLPEPPKALSHPDCQGTAQAQGLIVNMLHPVGTSTGALNGWERPSLYKWTDLREGRSSLAPPVLTQARRIQIQLNTTQRLEPCLCASPSGWEWFLRQAGQRGSAATSPFLPHNLPRCWLGITVTEPDSPIPSPCPECRRHAVRSAALPVTDFCLLLSGNQIRQTTAVRTTTHREEIYCLKS